VLSGTVASAILPPLAQTSADRRDAGKFTTAARCPSRQDRAVYGKAGKAIFLQIATSAWWPPRADIAIRWSRSAQPEVRNLHFSSPRLAYAALGSLLPPELSLLSENRSSSHEMPERAHPMRRSRPFCTGSACEPLRRPDRSTRNRPETIRRASEHRRDRPSVSGGAAPSSANAGFRQPGQRGGRVRRGRPTGQGQGPRLEGRKCGVPADRRRGAA